MMVRAVLLFALIVLSSVISITASIVNQNVERTLDLSTQLVRETLKITAEESSSSFKEYALIIPEEESRKLAYISVTDSAKREVNVRAEKEKPGHYLLTFRTPAPTQTFSIDLVFTNNILPHPVEITQSEKQLVRYSGLLYFYSPYKTTTQKLSVKLSSSNIISHTQEKPFTVNANKIKYGPYESVEALAREMLVIHYENQTPFMTVTHLERTIEISHWGNIAVKETVYLTHSGAKLKGSFSRYEFQKDGRSGQSAVKSYKTMLPASASGVYYRDTNGNISTSNMRVLRDSVELELRPRFPLFGGWKTYYTLGYNVPSFEYLYNQNDQFLLKMRVIDHVFDDMVIDEATVKIILPEGASNIKLTTPYPVKRSADGLHHTYLDTIGRPTITFSKTNLVENHIADFELKYTFSALSQLQEPLLVVAFIFIIFILTIIFLRLDFSIASGSNKEHRE